MSLHSHRHYATDAVAPPTSRLVAWRAKTGIGTPALVPTAPTAAEAPVSTIARIAPAPIASAPCPVKRMQAVLGSPEIAGHERIAVEILTDSTFNGLSASAVVKVLAMRKANIAAAVSEEGRRKAAIEAQAAQQVEINAEWRRIHAEIETRDRQATGIL